MPSFPDMHINMDGKGDKNFSHLLQQLPLRPEPAHQETDESDQLDAAQIWAADGSIDLCNPELATNAARELHHDSDVHPEVIDYRNYPAFEPCAYAWHLTLALMPAHEGLT